MISVDSSIDSEMEEEEDTGLAVEHEDPQAYIKRPFDPEMIKVRTINVIVEQLISRIKHDEIDLAPEFQRLRGIWDIERKSRLVESLLLRIPIPVFYVAANEVENWSVVDGLQRISTMYDYVTGQFALSGLEYLSQLSERKFDDLPRSMQRRISETQLVVNVIEPGTPDEVMFNIFRRINTGGLTLNGQEIRHALHKGPVRNYLRELAETEEFIAASDGSVRKKRMADRECALRFLAFYIDPWEEYVANDLDGYLGRAMDKVNDMSRQQRDAIAAEFRKAMQAAIDIFDNDAFRKRSKPDDPRRPVSKALFEAWSVHLARCSPKQISTLITKRKEVRRRFIALMRDDREFDVAISYGTGVPQRVEKRFRAIEMLVKEFI